MRTRLAAFLLALPAAAAAALGPRYGGELTLGLLDLPASLEPAAPRGSEELLVSGLVHETLVGIAPEGLPVPALVEGWATAAGGREWTLRLREGATFHDDRPVGSEDALRSLRRFLRSPSAAAARLADGLEGGAAFRSRSTEDLPGLASPDASRLVLRFVQDRPLPLAPLASRAAVVTSPTGAGCGPFVPTLQVPGRRIGLTAFGAHVRGRPFLDRVQVLAAADREAVHAELQAGRIDLGPGERGPSALAATLLLFLDSSRPPFDRAEARAAASAAVDRLDLVRHFLSGGDPSPTLLVPALLPPLGLDDAARRGALGGSLVMAVAKDVPPLVSQRIVAYLGAAGLDVRVVAASPAAVQSTPGEARLLLWLPEVPEAGLALEELASLAPAVPAVQEALAAAARETDLDRRRADLHRAEAALRSGHVLVPVASAPVSYAQRRGVHGARVDLGGRLVLEDAWVEP